MENGEEQMNFLHYFVGLLRSFGFCCLLSRENEVRRDRHVLKDLCCTEDSFQIFDPLIRDNNNSQGIRSKTFMYFVIFSSSANLALAGKEIRNYCIVRICTHESGTASKHHQTSNRPTWCLCRRQPKSWNKRVSWMERKSSLQFFANISLQPAGAVHWSRLKTDSKGAFRWMHKYQEARQALG